MTRYEVAPAAEIPAGEMKAYSVAGTRVIIIHLDDGFAAVSELCPHLSVPLSRGKREGDCLTCVGHGSAFNLRDGSVIRWVGRKPGLISRLVDGKPKTLKCYEVRVENDTLYVEL
jgi:3-phenylpropionate/trans-cinnamate dioxygenase ferredoxin subunit